MNRTFLREIGLDIGMDRRLRPWILEANTRPDPYIFRKLPGQRMFRRVMRYAKLNGRFNPW